MNQNQIKGMMIGLALGDALGAPHEFKRNVEYTGKLYTGAQLKFQFQPLITFEIGQITDDTEMTLALSRQIIKDRKYIEDNVILAYMKWANSKIKGIGKNTSALFRGIKTLKGFRNRYEKRKEIETQSNGSLMRCAPLALLNDDSYIDDCNLTNHNDFNLEIHKIYIKCLRNIFKNKKREENYNDIKTLATIPEVKKIFRDVYDKIHRDLSINKGWIAHALYCFLWCLLYAENYKQGIDWVISHKGSDTDTNACISGSVLGALFGYDTLIKDKDTKENIDILLKCKPDRPDIYTLYDIDDICDQLSKLN